MSRTIVIWQRFTNMNDTQNDRHLHLIRVGEYQGIIRSMPRGIDTNGIGMATRDRFYHALDTMRPCPSGAPDCECFGEDVVVHETSEDCEDAHEQDDIATAVQS